MKHYIHHIKENLLKVSKTIRLRLNKIWSLLSSSSKLLNLGFFGNDLYYYLFIKYNYFFVLFLYSFFSILFNQQFYSFSIENLNDPDPKDINYLDYQDFLKQNDIQDIDKKRTCYQVMNEPYPFERPMAIGYPNGDWTYYSKDGTRHDYIGDHEISVKEAHPPQSYKHLFPDNDSGSSSSESESESDSESESESESDSEKKVDLNINKITNILQDPDYILDEYLNYTSQGNSDLDIIILSLQYVEKIIPEHLWACSENDIHNTSHKFYKFLDEFNSKASLDTEKQRISFVQFNATLNAKNILNTNPSSKDNIELVTQVFDSCMQTIIKAFST